MKLYSVKPEWLYGDDKDAKREVQLEILKRLGIQESKTMEMAICNAEQAIELLQSGYCGHFLNPKDVITSLSEIEERISYIRRKG